MKALYVLNWLNIRENDSLPPGIKHLGELKKSTFEEKPPVQWYDVKNNNWKGPVRLLTWGRGYACILTETGTRWLPAKWIRPWKDEVHSSDSGGDG